MAVCKFSKHSEKLKGKLQTFINVRNFLGNLKTFLAALMAHMAAKQDQKGHSGARSGSDPARCICKTTLLSLSLSQSDINIDGTLFISSCDNSFGQWC